MLILAIVCVAWLEIIGIQSAKKEARRREAVERLSGMMDAFMYTYQSDSLASDDYVISNDLENCTCVFIRDRRKKTPPYIVHKMFENDDSPIGYQLRVVPKDDENEGNGVALPDGDLFGSSWNPDHRWLVGRLFDYNGSEDAARKPFFTLSVCLGR